MFKNVFHYTCSEYLTKTTKLIYKLYTIYV